MQQQGLKASSGFQISWVLGSSSPWLKLISQILTISRQSIFVFIRFEIGQLEKSSWGKRETVDRQRTKLFSILKSEEFWICWKLILVLFLYSLELIFNGLSSFWQSRPNIRELCSQQIPLPPAVQNGKKQARLVQVVKIRQTVTSWHHITPNDFKSARHVISKQAHSRQWYVWRRHWRKTGKKHQSRGFSINIRCRAL